MDCKQGDVIWSACDKTMYSMRVSVKSLHHYTTHVLCSSSRFYTGGVLMG